MKNTIFLFLLGVLSAAVLPAPSLRAEDATATYLIQSGRQPGQIDRVAVVLKIAGDRLQRAGEQSHRQSMSGAGNLTYDEKTLDAAATPDGHRPLGPLL